MKTLMLIGYGAMANEVIQRLPAGIELGWIVAREHHHNDIKQRFQNRVIPLSCPTHASQKPDLILECASQHAVKQYAPMVLEKGWTLAVISTGALADAQLAQTLSQKLNNTTLSLSHYQVLLLVSMDYVVQKKPQSAK